MKATAPSAFDRKVAGVGLMILYGVIILGILLALPICLLLALPTWVAKWRTIIQSLQKKSA